MADYQEAIQRPYLSKPSMSGQLQPSHHLLANGQGTMPTKPNCPALPTVEGKPSLVSAFSEEKYRKGIASLKNNKAAGIDGKSCTSQLLNFTQHIEDGYQRGMITGASFVDLSADYDTVNHRILIQKLYNTTQDSQLCRVFQKMLSNR